MDNHPIPQDVAGFQFKLIGEMTVKQFAYLAVGSVLAWFFFSVNIPIFIKLPLIFLCAGSGVLLAFVPFEGRPLDTMISLFVKALFVPNQFVYQKIGGLLMPEIYSRPAKQEVKQSTNQKEKLQFLLQPTSSKPKSRLDEKELAFLNSVSNIYSNNSQQAPLQADNATPLNLPNLNASFQNGFDQNPIPTVQELPDKTPEEIKTEKPKSADEKLADVIEEEKALEREALIIEKELAATDSHAKPQQVTQPQPAAQIQATQPVSENAIDQKKDQKSQDLEAQLKQILMQKEELEKELYNLQQRFNTQSQQTFAPTTTTQKQQTQFVRKVSQDMHKVLGAPLFVDVPNLVAGVIKDPRGNVLPNILVEIKDKEGNPVRAFKTNKLGQFASATPLVNGTYTVWFEDPLAKQNFDPIEISLNNEIVQALEIISKDQREDLRKFLFQ